MIYAAAFARLVIAGLFAMSFLSKVKNIAPFKKTIGYIGFVNGHLVGFIAYGVLFFEISITILLLMGRVCANLGYSISIALMLVFIYVIYHMVDKRMNMPCNCFGVDNGAVTIYGAYRNIVIIFISIIGVATSSNLYESTFGLSEYLVLSVPAVICIALISNFEMLMGLLIGEEQ